HFLDRTATGPAWYLGGNEPTPPPRSSPANDAGRGTGASSRAYGSLLWRHGGTWTRGTTDGVVRLGKASPHEPAFSSNVSMPAGPTGAGWKIGSKVPRRSTYPQRSRR